MDGGVRSSDNADLVTGSAEIVVVSPLGLDPPFPSPLPLRDVVGRLRAEGSAVTVISPDAASGAALGVNPLDPAGLARAPPPGRGRLHGEQLIGGGVAYLGEFLHSEGLDVPVLVLLLAVTLILLAEPV